MWKIDKSSRQLFTVDLATGVGTLIHQFGAKDPVFYSLAYTGEKPTSASAATWGALKGLYRK